MGDPVQHQASPSGRDRRALRRRFRALRRALTAGEQASHTTAIIRHFFTSGLALRGRTTGLYFATDGEVDLSPLFARLQRMRRRVALPVVHADGRMTFRRCRADTPLRPNRYGILEPTRGVVLAPLGLDVLLVPLVAFDRFGTRLGMGAGYYDRYLGRVAPDLRPLLVGVAHELQRSRARLPCSPWDVPLDGVLTEAGWQPFGN